MSIRGGPSQRPILDKRASGEQLGYEQQMTSLSLRSVSDISIPMQVPPVPMAALQRNVSVQQVIDEIDSEAALPVGSVVQLYATGVKPIYTSPWMVSEQTQWTGSGFCITGRRIVTNAHCAEHATVLQVQRQDHPKKWRARATTLAHDLDLAIVEVDDDEFWADAVVADLSPASHAVELYSEVNAVGFPTGGSTLCVTKGVISRFDAQLYIHPMLNGVVENSKNSPGPVFILQVDSAINPGNSGGPAVDEMGRVVGVASSGREDGQNIGFVIPVSIVHLFLDEVEKTGKWSGVCELGLTCRDLESDSYRAFLGMQENATGVLVEEVAPLGALHSLVKAGDVLTHMDSLRVSNEGKVPLSISGQQVYCSYEALVTRKPKGEETEFTLLRKDKSDPDGALQTITISVAMAPVPPLAPRFHNFDAYPYYILIGGLVFSRLSVPIFRENVTHSLFRCINKYKKNEEHEAVIIVNILRHDINIGSEEDDALLKRVNGVDIKNLRQLAEIAQHLEEPPEKASDEEEFVRFYFEKEDKDKTDLPDIVLQRSDIAIANKEICEAYAVNYTISPRLLGEAEEQGKQDPTCVRDEE